MSQRISKQQLQKMRKFLQLKQPLYAVKQSDMDQPMLRDSQAIQDYAPIGHTAKGPGILYKPMYNKTEAAYQLAHMKAHANVQDKPVQAGSAVSRQDVDRGWLRGLGWLTGAAGLGAIGYAAAQRNSVFGIGGALALLLGGCMTSANDYVQGYIDWNKASELMDKRYQRQTQLMADNTVAALKHINAPAAKLPSAGQLDKLKDVNRIQQRLYPAIVASAIRSMAAKSGLPQQLLLQLA